MLLHATDLQLVVNHPFTCTIGFGVVRVSPDFLEIYLLLDNISNDMSKRTKKLPTPLPTSILFYSVFYLGVRVHIGSVCSVTLPRGQIKNYSFL